MPVTPEEEARMLLVLLGTHSTNARHGVAQPQDTVQA